MPSDALPSPDRFDDPDQDGDGRSVNFQTDPLADDLATHDTEALPTVPQASLWGNPWLSAPSLAQGRSGALPIWDHAAPLASLRERDLQELQGWFDREDMHVLEQDLLRRLSYLCPEPLWEDLII
ncbi:MAG: hypothetical protein VKJ24_11720 [Synechococcales bacterium]|nr:hypothetical protein [Synechococcales bacterium]